MRIKFFIFFLTILMVGCSPTPYINPSLGYMDGRRVVIVGERVSPDLAMYYQRTYDAPVWFTPSEGTIVDAGSKWLEVGPSRGMKVLINELQSINYTVGQWEIIVPKGAEDYVLSTFKHMNDHSLAKARGMIVLIDSLGNSAIEAQVKRISDGNFFVSYELHKDLK